MSSFKAGSGKYNAPASTSTVARPGSMDDGDSSGLKSGLSALEGLDAEAHGPMLDYDVDPMTGNAVERIEPYDSDKASKNGLSFDIC